MTTDALYITQDHAGIQPASGLLEAALAYAHRGWRIVPVSDAPPAKPHHSTAKYPKQPLQRARGPLARLPRPWDEFASDDEAQVRAWWEHWSTAAVGVATGGRSGLLVLHVDADDAAISDYLAQLPQTVTAHANGITDYYFRMPTTDVPIYDQTGILPAGIHVRGEKQYVLAPPSMESEGNPYRWLQESDEIPLASLPAFTKADILKDADVEDSSAEAVRVEDARQTCLVAALEWVASGAQTRDAAKWLARELRYAQFDRVREATPVMQMFVAKVQRMGGPDRLTQSDGDNIVKQAYRGVPAQLPLVH